MRSTSAILIIAATLTLGSLSEETAWPNDWRWQFQSVLTLQTLRLLIIRCDQPHRH